MKFFKINKEIKKNKKNLKVILKMKKFVFKKDRYNYLSQAEIAGNFQIGKSARRRRIKVKIYYLISLEN